MQNNYIVCIHWLNIVGAAAPTALMVPMPMEQLTLPSGDGSVAKDSAGRDKLQKRDSMTSRGQIIFMRPPYIIKIEISETVAILYLI